MDPLVENSGRGIMSINSLQIAGISFYLKIWCFFINFMINYDKTVPKLHDYINILMKKQSSFVIKWYYNNVEWMCGPNASPQKTELYTPRFSESNNDKIW